MQKYLILFCQRVGGGGLILSYLRQFAGFVTKNDNFFDVRYTGDYFLDFREIDTVTSDFNLRIHSSFVNYRALDYFSVVTGTKYPRII